MAFYTGRRSLTTFISRALSHKLSPSFSSSSSRARYALASLAHPPSLFPSSTSLPTRFKSTGGHSPLDDPSPNWSNRPPKETILLDGCDYVHWLVVLEFPRDKKPSDEEMINAYVKTLAEVVGSEEEAKKKIYSVSTTTYTGFGCLISEELSYKLKEVPGVLWVLPDSYLDVPNKDYGGDLYDNGKVTRRPQYDFSQREPTKTRNRPRHDNRRDSRPVERRGPPQSQGNQTQPQRTPVEPRNPSQAGAGESTGV